MWEDVWLPIKVSDIVQRFQEKIAKLAINDKDTLEEVHKYKLFTNELRALIERWEKII